MCECYIIVYIDIIIRQQGQVSKKSVNVTSQSFLDKGLLSINWPFIIDCCLLWTGKACVGGLFPDIWGLNLEWVTCNYVHVGKREGDLRVLMWCRRQIERQESQLQTGWYGEMGVKIVWEREKCINNWSKEFVSLSNYKNKSTTTSRLILILVIQTLL